MFSNNSLKIATLSSDTIGLHDFQPVVIFENMFSIIHDSHLWRAIVSKNDCLVIGVPLSVMPVNPKLYSGNFSFSSLLKELQTSVLTINSSPFKQIVDTKISISTIDFDIIANDPGFIENPFTQNGFIKATPLITQIAVFNKDHSNKAIVLEIPSDLVGPKLLTSLDSIDCSSVDCHKDNTQKRCCLSISKYEYTCPIKVCLKRCCELTKQQFLELIKVKRWCVKSNIADDLIDDQQLALPSDLFRILP